MRVMYIEVNYVLDVNDRSPYVSQSKMSFSASLKPTGWNEREAKVTMTRTSWEVGDKWASHALKYESVLRYMVILRKRKEWTAIFAREKKVLGSKMEKFKHGRA